ncbi:CooT family nickel-binding protein [Candidatus Bathyarchaeota archaeon]|nr:CooT family nickel-binding protein [Candidatus Bathyarchaeota archaeon]
MCLLKVYVKEPDLGMKLVARDVAFIFRENGSIRIVDVESKEKTITGMEILSIDALKSILILKFNRYLFRKKSLLFRFTTFLIETFIKIHFLISESKEN